MRRRTISPEIDFILKSLRWIAAKPSGPRHLDTTSLQLRRLHWREIMEIGQSHRVSGFIAFALEQNNLFDSLDHGIRSALTNALIRAEWSNRAKLAEFKKIGWLFLKKRIEVIPLKGIELSLRVYRDMPFRQMGDVDLLIRERDLLEASSFLFSQGFRLRTDPPMKNRWHDSLYPKDTTPFQKTPFGRKSFEKDGLDIDLHWKPTYPVGGHAVSMDQESAWSKARTDAALGENILRLSEEDLSWHLILHTAEMATPTLIQLLDIASVMNRWSAWTSAEIDQRVSRLQNSSKKRIGALLRDVQTLLCETDPFLKRDSYADDLLDFFVFQRNSDRYPKPRLRAYGSLPFLKQCQFLAGYLFPNPEYYQDKIGKRGLSMYLAHWKYLAKNTGNLLGGKPKR